MISKWGRLASRAIVQAGTGTCADAQADSSNAIIVGATTIANRNLATRRAGSTPTCPSFTAERASLFGDNTTIALNPPRTYGVEVQHRF